MIEEKFSSIIGKYIFLENVFTINVSWHIISDPGDWDFFTYFFFLLKSFGYQKRSHTNFIFLGSYLLWGPKKGVIYYQNTKKQPTLEPLKMPPLSWIFNLTRWISIFDWIYWFWAFELATMTGKAIFIKGPLAPPIISLYRMIGKKKSQSPRSDIMCQQALKAKLTSLFNDCIQFF